MQGFETNSVASSENCSSSLRIVKGEWYMKYVRYKDDKDEFTYNLKIVMHT